MHYASIHIKPQDVSEPVEQFARRVYQKLGIAKMEERFLPNQDSRSYYVGSAAGIEFHVGPQNGKLGYPFFVSFGLDPSSQSAEYLVEHAHFLAYRWSRDGWQCLVPDSESAFRHLRSEQVYAAFGD